MGDESKPATPGDDEKATQPPVEMANDDGADPTSDIEQQNPGSGGDEKSGLDAAEAHPS